MTRSIAAFVVCVCVCVSVLFVLFVLRRVRLRRD
jgi:hypothetical protein